MIRSTEEKDILQLKNIWKSVFGDEDIYINDYFSQVFQTENSWCYEDNGKLGAMLYIIPCKIKVSDSKSVPAYYFYALATLEEYRKHGIMGAMIEMASKHINEIGVTNMFLIPANDNLINYYKKFGFCTMSKITGYNISEEIQMREIQAEQMRNLIESDWIFSNVNVLFDSAVHLFYLNDLSRYHDYSMCEIIKDNKSAGFVINRTFNGKIMPLQYGTNDERIAKLFYANTEDQDNAKVIAARSDSDFALLNGLIPV